MTSEGPNERIWHDALSGSVYSRVTEWPRHLAPELALDTVAQVDRIARAWEASAPSVRREGGIGILDQRATARVLDVDTTTAEELIRAVTEARLFVPAGTRLAPSTIAQQWSRSDTAARWALLATPAALQRVGGEYAEVRADLESGLRTELPEPVSELLIQSDYTGIIPGLPSARLEWLIWRACEVESRSAATVVRFTSSSIRGALSSHVISEPLTVPELTAELTAACPYPLPQPLTYLIADAERRSVGGQGRQGAVEAGQRAEAATRTASPHPADPGPFTPEAFTLRAAIADKAEVSTEVNMGGGRWSERRLLPLRLDGHRLRAEDVARETELTVAISALRHVRRIEQ
ncbi:MAG: helicase-associated domain-containing protein [Cellulomonadaceae bacterium]|jgi:hypothetical protein|nr:helicase-associated domain-containing protein [Cellulomonadaceae bacterium]